MTSAYGEPGALRTRVKQGLTRLARLARVRVAESAAWPPLTEAELQSLRAFFSRPKFFIIGYPRSGTTLLARLVRLHPRVHCNWQAHFFTQVGSLSAALGTQELVGWVRRENNRWMGAEQGIGVLLRAAMDYIMESEATALGKPIVGDKSPDSAWSRQLSLLHSLYPDARVVNIVRDGRDVALSRRIQQLIDQPDLLDRRGRALRRELQSQGARQSASRPSLFDPGWLAAEARQWDREVREADAVAARDFGDQYMAVGYESLLEEPEQIMRAIWLFLGAGRSPRSARKIIAAAIGENPAADWHRQAAPGIVAGIPRGTSEGWRQVMTEAESRLFAEHAAAGLQRWGYPLE
jgi:hypothetical protein